MRYRVFVVLVSVVMLLPGVLTAQDDETWYFAWKPETGEVVAYTAEGEVNTILEGVERRADGWRLGSQTSLIKVYLSNGILFYKLTPNSAELLTQNFEFADLPDPSPLANLTIRFEDRSRSYVVLTARALNGYAGLLINLENNSIDLLDDHMVGMRFSRDGQALRYISGSNPETTTWYLRERRLATGEERIIYSFNDSYLYWIEPDTYGEHWLWYTAEDRNATYAHVIINIDGSLEPVGEPLPEGYLDQRHFLGDNLVVSDWYCTEDCSIRVFPPNQDSPIEFSIPDAVEAGDIETIGSMRLIDANRLLVVASPHHYWLLQSDGTSQYLGVRGDLAGRWLLVWDNYAHPQYYQVWDILDGEVVYEANIATSHQVNIGYGSEVAFFQRESTDPTSAGTISIALHFVDGRTLELPIDGVGGYFELLPDETLLYNESVNGYSNTRTVRMPGIYRYDPSHRIFLMLVEDAENISLQDLTENED